MSDRFVLSSLRTGPEATMHVSRGLPGSLPAGREEEGRRHRAGDLPSRVQSAGEHFESRALPASPTLLP